MSQPRMLSLVFTVFGLLFIGLSLPLALEKIGPNNWYGFRTERTLSNPTIWYAANKVMGYDLLIAGVVVLITSLAVFAMGQEYSMKTVGIINLIAFVGSVILAVVHSSMALGRL